MVPQETLPAVIPGQPRDGENGGLPFLRNSSMDTGGEKTF
jgi:hypothetical protein